MSRRTGHSEPLAANVSAAGSLRGVPDVAMIGFLAVEIVIGYEWLISGLVKLVRGGFPSGLADELVEKSPGAADWYVRFLEKAVIPNGPLFGWLIQVSELLAGIVLIAGPIIWIFAWARVPDWLRASILLFGAAAALGGAFLAINLHLANGASHPWLFPQEGFDEGIDLDSVLPAIQLVIVAVHVVLLRRLWRTRTESDAASPHSHQRSKNELPS